MDLKLKGRTALVTGSTKGIGRSIAQMLHDEGATVLINGRSQHWVDDTVRSLGNERAYGVVGDVGTAEGCDGIIERAKQIAPVDILVNNAAIFAPEPFDEITDERWQQFFEVNVMSGVRLSRAFKDEMRDRGWGRIIFISSESGENTPVEMIHYGTTKSAQQALSRGLARELAGTGVTVNSVLPGPTWTEGVAGFVQQLAQQEGRDLESFKAEFVPHARPTSLIGRFAEPEEAAYVAAMLCSPRSAAATGAAFRVEGGIVNTCF
jgi:NAD(P)-dependent dehydrogenase (short-subunit alcohol dehydrogenase family)